MSRTKDLGLRSLDMCGEGVRHPHNAYLKIVPHFNLFQTLSFCEEIEYLAFWKEFWFFFFWKQYTYIHVSKYLHIANMWILTLKNICNHDCEVYT